MEHGPGTIAAGVPSSLGFVVGGQKYFDFLASTVRPDSPPGPHGHSWSEQAPLAQALNPQRI